MHSSYLSFSVTEGGKGDNPEVPAEAALVITASCPAMYTEKVCHWRDLLFAEWGALVFVLRLAGGVFETGRIFNETHDEKRKGEFGLPKGYKKAS